MFNSFDFILQDNELPAGMQLVSVQNCLLYYISGIYILSVHLQCPMLGGEVSAAAVFQWVSFLLGSPWTWTVKILNAVSLFNDSFLHVFYLLIWLNFHKLNRVLFLYFDNLTSERRSFLFDATFHLLMYAFLSYWIIFLFQIGILLFEFIYDA